MTVTPIPKSRLVQLILDDLRVSKEAKAFFNIRAETDTAGRLESFTKDQLLTFIAQIGAKGEGALRSLEASFPLRRPPTLYLTVIEHKPPSDNMLAESTTLARKGRSGGIDFGENDVIRFMYLPQNGITLFSRGSVKLLEFQLHYECKIEYIESNEKSDEYGQLTTTHSLETAFVWLPLTKYSHAITACSDYPALKRIRHFMRIKLSIDLNPPWLNQEMIEKITHGSIPRSITYSMQPLVENVDEPQSITIADPLLLKKALFRKLAKDSDRQQVSGFYTAHPGLAMGGIGIARRDGKIWTPRKLDRKEILDLSLEIIDQTESELAKTNDLSILVKYFRSNRTTLGMADLQEAAREVWGKLALLVLETIKNQKNENDVPASLINSLVRYQKQLRILTAVEYDCPACGLRWLAKCPDCNELLILGYEEHLSATCPKCRRKFVDHLSCMECGAEIPIGDIVTYCNIMPEKELNDSIEDLALKCRIPYRGLWSINGLSLRWADGTKQPKYPVLKLSDFRLWRNRAKIDIPVHSLLSPELAITVLNKTHEKCERDGTKASTEKCQQCIDNKLNPGWIKQGDTCLLRLFGLPIDHNFDGIHHKHEVADLRYRDTLIPNGRSVNVGIHVKSRHIYCPPEGMGLSKYQIQGLYKQTVYSAFQSAVLEEDLDVIGIAIPNKIRDEVVKSLAYAVNTLGFSFLVINEEDWLNIIRLAFNHASFDFEDSPVD